MGLKEILFGEDEKETAAGAAVTNTAEEKADSTQSVTDASAATDGAVKKEMLVGEIIQKHPSAAQFLMDCGMECIFCPASQMESLEEACAVHGIDSDEIVVALNEKLAAE